MIILLKEIMSKDQGVDCDTVIYDKKYIYLVFIPIFDTEL